MENEINLNEIYGSLDKLSPDEIDKVIQYLQEKKLKKQKTSYNGNNEIIGVLDESNDKIRIDDLEFYIHSNCFIYGYKDISYTNTNERSLNNNYFLQYDSDIEEGKLIIKKHKLGTEYTMIEPTNYGTRAGSYIGLTLFVKNGFEIQDNGDIEKYLKTYCDGLDKFGISSKNTGFRKVSSLSELSEKNTNKLIDNAKTSLVVFLNKNPEKIKKTLK